MSTNELTSMVTETKNVLERYLQNLSEEYIATFKVRLSQRLNESPWLAYSKKIGLPISVLTKSDFETDAFIFWGEDKNYETENLTPIDDYYDLMLGNLVKEELSAFINPLKDYGFKLFVSNNKRLIPFIEID